MSDARIEVQRAGPPQPWLGQLVPVEVDVWRPEGPARLEPFSMDDVVAAGLIAKWSAQAAPPDERQEGDTHFLVQHRTLLVFPQADGELTLPPIVARWTDPATKTNLAAQSAPVHFSAAIPPAAGDELPLVATSVQLEQKLDRELSGLRVGDGFTRTLTLAATDTDPIMLPELSLPASSGLSAYPSPPRASSNSERGLIQAQEAVRITVVIERVGRHTLAGHSVRWLEPRSGRYLEASVPELTFWAAPNPSLGFQCLGTAHATAVATELGSLGVLGLLVLAVLRRLRRGPGTYERALKRRSRERRAFHEVLRAARQGTRLRLLERMYTWLAIRNPAGLDRTLSKLAAATPAAGAACAELQRELFRNASTEPPPRPGPVLARTLRRARRALGRTQRRAELSSLNPTSTIKGEPS